MSLSPGVHGGHGLAGSSLLTVAAVLDCIQAEPDGGDLILACLNSFIPCTLLPGLRVGNRLAGGSLLKFSAILVHIQAEWRGGGYVLVFVNNFIPCTFLPGCAGESGLLTALY